MERTFTLAEARETLAGIRDEVDELIVVRRDLATKAAAHNAGQDVPIPEIKALEARMGEILDGFRAIGIQVKGYAPLLLDFPLEAEGEPVLLCWLENETGLDWYHDDTTGFMGRRPIEELGAAGR